MFKKLFEIFHSTRFWALVIGGLAIVSEGGFTFEAWTKGIVFVVSGFTIVRTVDKLGK